MTDVSIDADREAYRAFYDTQVSGLLSGIWGGSLHLGLFAAPGESLGHAQFRLKDYMARAAGLRPEQHIIEAGCGVGATAIYLAQTYGVKVRATNISQVQLDEGAERVRAAGLSDVISLAFADYHDLREPSSTYDCWWSQEALLYATDRKQVFSEARRVVKRGGRIVFTDLTMSERLAAAEREAFMADIRAPHLWPVEHYDRLLADMNFRVLERQDFSSHVAWTFAAVARNLEQLRSTFASLIGEETVRGTEFRIARQLEMARGGHLGWCFYAIEV